MKPTTKEWLDRAADDLQAISLLINEAAMTNVVAFHAQQAVEKSLKAVIEEFSLGFIKTHNLIRLYAVVKPHYDVVENEDILERLNLAYLDSRYPNDMGLIPYSKPTLAEAQTFYRASQTIYQQLVTKLTADATEESSN